MKEKKKLKNCTKEELVNKYNKMKKHFIAGAVALIISATTALGGMIAMYVVTLHDLSTNPSLKERLETVYDKQEYNAFVDSKRDELYNQLKNGEISAQKFADEYVDVKSGEQFIDWARTLESKEIKEIIAQYDKECEVLNNRFGVCMTIASAGMAAAGASIITNSCLDKKGNKVLNEIKKKEGEEQAER